MKLRRQIDAIYLCIFVLHFCPSLFANEEHEIVISDIVSACSYRRRIVDGRENEKHSLTLNVNQLRLFVAGFVQTREIIDEHRKCTNYPFNECLTYRLMIVGSHVYDQ